MMSAPSNPAEPIGLRAQIALRLDNGTLPAAGNQKIFGGYGANQACAACDAPVLENEVLYEVEVQREDEVIVIAIHRRCFDLWMEESLARRRRNV
jgi:hypothetical protein